MSNKKCTACGKSLESGVKFCPECGSSTRKKSAIKTASNSFRDTLIIGGVIVVVAVAYFIFKEPAEIPQPPVQVQDTNPGHADMGSGMGEVLANLPNDYNSLVQAGNQSMDQGNFPMAAECYKRALVIQDNINVRTDYGACLHGMGLPERAIEEFRVVMKKDPTHTISVFNMGIVFYSTSQPDSAKIYWEKYLDMDPTGASAEAARGYLKQIDG